MIDIISISKFKPPQGIIDEYTNIGGNYNFIYDILHNYECFINDNPINEYKLNDFKKINSDFLKRLVFILYYLYVKGGIYIDLHVVPTVNINNLNFNDFSLLSVVSILNDKNLFLGIIGCKKNESNILQLIYDLTNIDCNDNSLLTSLIYNKIINTNNVLLLHEKNIFDNCVSTVNINGDVLFNHYYDDNKFYKFPLKNIEPTVKTEKNIKIGITLNVFKEVKQFCSNGINQNSLYLCELLLNAGFDTYFILSDTNLMDITDENLKIQLYDDRFKFVKYSDILTHGFDIFITLSFSDSNIYVHNYLKYMNTKIVGYFCGNSYIIDTEKILYNQHKNIQEESFQFYNNNKPRYDEIWSIPQMSDLNLHYWKILYRCNVTTVPFVWSRNAIKLHSIINNCHENDLLYKIKNTEKKIAILEPNISIMKWALPAILICENCYRNNKNIKHLYINNITSDSKIVDLNLNKFNKFMNKNNFDLIKDKKCSIESRYNTLEFMSKIADVVVSHQWGNPLNYLYFDLAWLGYPIVHNASLCKDVGYYYEGFDYTQASEVLNDVLHNHDHNLKKYILNNRKNIDRFLSDNIVLIAKYKQLIFNLLN